MNKIEALKSEKDGLEIKRDIERFAKEGWESISEEDIHRLKWLGLFLRKPTPGFFMLRVRIPNGIAFSYQATLLALQHQETLHLILGLRIQEYCFHSN